MSIETDIQEAIDRSLPNEVAGRLKTFIEKAEADAEELEFVHANREQTVADYRELNKLRQKEEAIDKKLADLSGLRRQLETEKAVMTAREGERSESRRDIYELARIAFDNPRLKFSGKLQSHGRDGLYADADIEGGETTARDDNE